MASTFELLRRLVREKVEFVLVGGMAAPAHGSVSVTEDVDVCVRFDAGTIGRLERALSDLQPDLDVRVIGLADLILSKRTVARPKDLRVARELELVLAQPQKK